jgi:hypothetical protein
MGLAVKLSKLKLEKTLFAIPIFFAFFALLLWVVGFVLARPAADDYCGISSATANGFVRSLISYWSSGSPLYSALIFSLIPLTFSAGAPIIFNVSLVLFFVISCLALVSALKILNVLHSKDFEIKFLLSTLAMLIVLSSGYFGETLGWYTFFWMSSVVVHTLPIFFGVLILSALYVGKIRSLGISIALAVFLAGFSIVEPITVAVLAVIIGLRTLKSNREITNNAFVFGFTILFIQLAMLAHPGTNSRLDAFSFESSIFERFGAAVIFHLAGIIEIKSTLVVIFLGIFLAYTSSVSFINTFKISLFFLMGFLVSLLLTAVGEAQTYRAVWHGIMPSLFFHIFATTFTMSLCLHKSIRVDRIDFDKKIISGLYVSIFSLFAIFALLWPVQLLHDRMTAWDSRWIVQNSTQLVPVPVTTKFGNQLLADTELKWASECFIGWKKQVDYNFEDDRVG